MTVTASICSNARPLVVFDDGLGMFGPLTDLRASFELRAGVGSLLERIERAVGRRADALCVPPALQALVADSTGRNTASLPSTDLVLAVNGRLLDATAARVAEGRVHADRHGSFVAGWIPPAALADLAAVRPTDTVEARLANAPWDLTAAIGTSLEEDLGLFELGSRRALRPDEGQSFGPHPIHIDATAVLGPSIVIDASKGPVIIGRGVVVRPMSVLVGPCAVLEGSSVAERSLLKAATVIGPHCRAGGEIGGTIFQAYSNKSHDGHLGDSFVGEWVNIGAGTDNSNLLNTYGEVIVRLDAGSGLVKTGRQFWGSILGDHVKLAIGTRLMTGTTIGTGAMCAQSRPPAALVGRFSWLVDAQEGARLFRFEKFMDTARAMMSRRGKTPSPVMEAALRDLHARASGA